jgi:hypothetical protein
MQKQVVVILENKKLRRFEIVWNFAYFINDIAGKGLFCTYHKKCLSFSNYI